MLKRNAHQKESTLNPGTSLLVSMIIKALIMKVNNPKVKILTGSVRTTRIGFRKILITPKTNATTSAIVSPAKCTPGNK